MSYKLGILLSLVFVVAFLFLGMDMLNMSTMYSFLDSASVSIGYSIAKEARVDTEFLSSLEERYKVSFLSLSPSAPALGDVIDFVIGKEYNPLVLSKNVITIKASRTTVLGYYG